MRCAPRQVCQLSPSTSDLSLFTHTKASDRKLTETCVVQMSDPRFQTIKSNHSVRSLLHTAMLKHQLPGPNACRNHLRPLTQCFWGLTAHTSNINGHTKAQHRNNTCKADHKRPVLSDKEVTKTMRCCVWCMQLCYQSTYSQVEAKGAATSRARLQDNMDCCT